MQTLMKTELHYPPQKRRPGTLVSGNIFFPLIFVGNLWRWASNDSNMLQSHFSHKMHACQDHHHQQQSFLLQCFDAVVWVTDKKDIRSVKNPAPMLSKRSLLGHTA